MKRALLATVLAVLALAGCAHDPAKPEPAAIAEAQIAQANARSLEATARIREAEAEKALAEKVDAGGASAYLLAKALKNMGVGQPAPQPVQVAQQPSALGLAWQTILQVADLAIRGYGVKANRDIAVIQSNNNRDVSVASYQAFTSMGNSIATAGAAGYPYVQAPQANQTISGSGVIGSGTYTGPVTTTTTTTTNRNCNGGTGAAGGGTDTGGAGGGGGSAPGGSC